MSRARTTDWVQPLKGILTMALESCGCGTNVRFRLPEYIWWATGEIVVSDLRMRVAERVLDRLLWEMGMTDKQILYGYISWFVEELEADISTCLEELYGVDQAALELMMEFN